MAGDESCKVSKCCFSSFILIHKGNWDVCFWIWGVSFITSKFERWPFVQINTSVNGAPLTPVPDSFFFKDLESVINWCWSGNFKLPVALFLCSSPLKGFKVKVNWDPAIFVVIWVNYIVPVSTGAFIVWGPPGCFQVPFGDVSVSSPFYYLLNTICRHLCTCEWEV